MSRWRGLASLSRVLRIQRTLCAKAHPHHIEPDAALREFYGEVVGVGVAEGLPKQEQEGLGGAKDSVRLGGAKDEQDGEEWVRRASAEEDCGAGTAVVGGLNTESILRAIRRQTDAEITSYFCGVDQAHMAANQFVIELESRRERVAVAESLIKTVGGGRCVCDGPL